ncbi:hypothetical protein B7494_g1662 [Chlorociboria aeruginascens]|nr:hypothetical protein B7494_g1662 [Chlorociboria aeruginascens]
MEPHNAGLEAIDPDANKMKCDTKIRDAVRNATNGLLTQAECNKQVTDGKSGLLTQAECNKQVTDGKSGLLTQAECNKQVTDGKSGLLTQAECNKQVTDGKNEECNKQIREAKKCLGKLTHKECQQKIDQALISKKCKARVEKGCRTGKKKLNKKQCDAKVAKDCKLVLTASGCTSNCKKNCKTICPSKTINNNNGGKTNPITQPVLHPGPRQVCGAPSTSISAGGRLWNVWYNCATTQPSSQSMLEGPSITAQQCADFCARQSGCNVAILQPYNKPGRGMITACTQKGQWSRAAFWTNKDPRNPAYVIIQAGLE